MMHVGKSHQWQAVYACMITAIAALTSTTDAAAATGGSFKLGNVADSSTEVPFPMMLGLNVPWNNFGYDIGGGVFNASFFSTYFAAAQGDGQNVARFWVHCDGARAGLLYNTDGTVHGLSPTFNADLRKLLTIAQQHSVVVQLCLWSFDMCKDETNKGSTKNHLITNQAATKSYVDKALRPMLAALTPFPNMIVEVINEPEWCMQGSVGSGIKKQDAVEVADMQRFAAMISAAVHDAGRKVTVGSASLKWSSHAAEAQASYWDDASLRKAYAGPNATLDFYNVHYYDWMFNADYGYDPMMKKNTSHWQLDKPTVVAEMVPTSQHYTPMQMVEQSTANGFEGVLFWAYNDPGSPVTPADVAALKGFSGASYSAVLAWLGAPTPPPTPPPCTDIAPDQQYTCAQQKSWGKCSQSFMKGFCCKTCFDCTLGCGESPAPPPPKPPPPPPPAPPAPTCADTPPAPGAGQPAYSCKQQAAWGKCNTKANPWMKGYCCQSCFHCAPGCGKEQ